MRTLNCSNKARVNLNCIERLTALADSVAEKTLGLVELALRRGVWVLRYLRVLLLSPGVGASRLLKDWERAAVVLPWL